MKLGFKMKDKFLCVMAQYDKKTDDKLKAIQKVLFDSGFVGKQTKDLPNHITLGTFDTAHEDRLTRKIKEASEKQNSFDIRLNNIGLFKLSVLFITPVVSHELLNLQRQFEGNYADGMGQHIRLC